MKRILFIGGLGENKNSEAVFHDYVEGVARVIGDKYEVFRTRVNALDAVIQSGDIAVFDNTNGRPVADYDLVVLHGYIRKYRDMAYLLSRFCHIRNIPYFNDFSAYYSGTKIGQAVVFAEAGVRIPKTVFSMGADNLLALAERELGLPLVLKDASGTKGELNYLVRDISQLRQHLADSPQITFIAQEYCSNDRDYRLLLSPAGELVFVRRGGADTHLNNTSQGGSAELVPEGLPEETVAAARKVARRLGLTLAGVDIMPHLQTGELFFIEINSQPQLFTGALLSEKADFTRDLFLSLLDKSDK